MAKVDIRQKGGAGGIQGQLLRAAACATSAAVVCPAGVLEQNAEGKPLPESDLNDGKAMDYYLCRQSVIIFSFNFSNMFFPYFIDAFKVENVSKVFV